MQGTLIDLKRLGEESRAKAMMAARSKRVVGIVVIIGVLAFVFLLLTGFADQRIPTPGPRAIAPGAHHVEFPNRVAVYLVREQGDYIALLAPDGAPMTKQCMCEDAMATKKEAYSMLGELGLGPIEIDFLEPLSLGDSVSSVIVFSSFSKTRHISGFNTFAELVRVIFRAYFLHPHFCKCPAYCLTLFHLIPDPTA